jgi:hypothetical protein
MPYAFFKAVEDTVRATLRQGLHGWEVTDCRVTMTRSGYCPRQSHAHARFDKSMSVPHTSPSSNLPPDNRITPARLRISQRSRERPGFRARSC